MLPAYQQLKFGDINLARLQQRVNASLSRILGVAFLDGVLLTNIQLSGSAPTNVSHGLGRAIVGWWLVDNQAASRVYRAPQGSLPISILPLQADAATTVSVWVF